jgi:hypothetical protein
MAKTQRVRARKVEVDLAGRLDELALEFWSAKRLQKESKAAYDAAKAEIMRVMGQVDCKFTESPSGGLVVSTHTAEWAFRAMHIESTRWDLERLERDHPELVAQYKTAKTESDRVDVEPFITGQIPAVRRDAKEVA